VPALYEDPTSLRSDNCTYIHDDGGKQKKNNNFWNDVDIACSGGVMNTGCNLEIEEESSNSI
jgi:hypothetical protein